MKADNDENEKELRIEDRIEESTDEARRKGRVEGTMVRNYVIIWFLVKGEVQARTIQGPKEFIGRPQASHVKVPS